MTCADNTYSGNSLISTPIEDSPSYSFYIKTLSNASPTPYMFNKKTIQVLM